MATKRPNHMRNITLPGRNRTQSNELNSAQKAPVDLFGPGSIVSPVEMFSPSFMTDMFGSGNIRPMAGTSDGTAQPTAGRSDKNRAVTERVIFDPADDRQPVFNTTSPPWRSVCRLQTNMSDGQIAFGTGWFASPNIVITAGHCIYPDGANPEEIIVTPGLSPTGFPYGSEVSIDVQVPSKWIEEKDDRYDYGVVILPNKNMGNMTGWFGFAVAQDSHLDGLPITSAGYPDDFGYDTQVWCLGKIKEPSRHFIYHDIDTETGQSGGPIFHEHQSNFRTVVGIHTGSDGANRPNVGVRITSSIFKYIAKAIKDNA